MTYIGVDVGGSHVTCALVSGGTLLAKRESAVPDNASLAKILPWLEDSINSLLNRSAHGRCNGIGLSFCGIVDSKSNRIVQSNGKYVDAASVDLTQWAFSKFKLPIRMDNDARAALLGERSAGAARGYDDIVMFVLGTGVGGAAMIDGRVLRGKHAQAGCLLGHFGCELSGRVCSCGNVGCAEAEASTAVLEEICRKHAQYLGSSLSTLPEIKFKDVFLHAAQGDHCAKSIRDRSLKVWAAAVVSSIHAYDPEVVVLGGGVMGAAYSILPVITEYVRRHAWTPWGQVVLCHASLGNEAALFAAEALFSEKQ